MEDVKVQIADPTPALRVHIRNMLCDSKALGLSEQVYEKIQQSLPYTKAPFPICSFSLAELNCLAWSLGYQDATVSFKLKILLRDLIRKKSQLPVRTQKFQLEDLKTIYNKLAPHYPTYPTNLLSMSPHLVLIRNQLGLINTQPQLNWSELQNIYEVIRPTNSKFQLPHDTYLLYFEEQKRLIAFVYRRLSNNIIRYGACHYKCENSVDTRSHRHIIRGTALKRYLTHPIFVSESPSLECKTQNNHPDFNYWARQQVARYGVSNRVIIQQIDQKLSMPQFIAWSRPKVWNHVTDLFYGMGKTTLLAEQELLNRPLNVGIPEVIQNNVNSKGALHNVDELDNNSKAYLDKLCFDTIINTTKCNLC